MRRFFGNPGSAAGATVQHDRPTGVAVLGSKSNARPGQDAAERAQAAATLPEAELQAATDLVNAYLAAVRVRGGRHVLTPDDLVGLGAVMGEFLWLVPAGDASPGPTLAQLRQRDQAFLAALEEELRQHDPAHAGDAATALRDLLARARGYVESCADGPDDPAGKLVREIDIVVAGYAAPSDSHEEPEAA